MGAKTDDDSSLIGRAQQGDREAFDALHLVYQKRVLGFIRARCDNDDVAHDLAQDTWIELWQRMRTYDKARGPFEGFAKYWAGIRLLRYYDARRSRAKVEALFSELACRFSGSDLEQDVPEIVGRVAARPADVTEHDVPPEVYEELLSIAFGPSSPPHQLIAFGFSKVSGMEQALASSERHPEEAADPTVTGRAQAKQVVAALSDSPLRELEVRLEQAYLYESGLPEERVRRGFQGLRESMERRVSDVVRDRKTLEIYAHLGDQTVGDTTLRDYYTHAESPEANIVQWWYAVQRRVLGEVRRRTGGVLSELLGEKPGRGLREGPETAV